MHNTPPLLPLSGTHLLSLALNLPGPAALMRCRDMGAHCTKLEPPATPPQPSADPMHSYSPAAYDQLHAGMQILHADLKSTTGQAALHQALAQTDVLLTSFRPAALDKLGLSWDSLHARHPRLCMVRIFGSTDPGEANHAGHDLTYQAQAGLTDDGHLPASLFADMAGAVMGSEAVLQTLLQRSRSGHGHCLDVGLAQAAQWLALPRDWGMTTPGGDVGGAHAGYRMYRCIDGWVALAALEPHFAQRIAQVAGLSQRDGSLASMHDSGAHAALERFFAAHRCEQLAVMAAQSDIPLHVIPGQDQ